MGCPCYSLNIGPGGNTSPHVRVYDTCAGQSGNATVPLSATFCCSHHVPNDTVCEQSCLSSDNPCHGSIKPGIDGEALAINPELEFDVGNVGNGNVGNGNDDDSDTIDRAKKTLKLKESELVNLIKRVILKEEMTCEGKYVACIQMSGNYGPMVDKCQENWESCVGLSGSIGVDSGELELDQTGSGPCLQGKDCTYDRDCAWDEGCWQGCCEGVSNRYADSGKRRVKESHLNRIVKKVIKEEQLLTEGKKCTKETEDVDCDFGTLGKAKCVDGECGEIPLSKSPPTKGGNMKELKFKMEDIDSGFIKAKNIGFKGSKQTLINTVNKVKGIVDGGGDTGHILSCPKCCNADNCFGACGGACCIGLKIRRRGEQVLVTVSCNI